MRPIKSLAPIMHARFAHGAASLLFAAACSSPVPRAGIGQERASLARELEDVTGGYVGTKRRPRDLRADACVPCQVSSLARGIGTPTHM